MLCGKEFGFFSGDGSFVARVEGGLIFCGGLYESLALSSLVQVSTQGCIHNAVASIP